jgi:hypothetical protein
MELGRELDRAVAGVLVATVRLVAGVTRVACRRLLFGKRGEVDQRAGFSLEAGGGIVGRTRRAWRRVRRYFGLGQTGTVDERGRSA